MRKNLTIAILAISINAFAQTPNSITVRFIDGACNDAACECNDCYWKFLETNGNELTINEIAENIKIELLLSKVYEEGYVEVTPNPIYVNKKFEILYTTTTCECSGVKPNKNYKKLVSIKMIE